MRPFLLILLFAVLVACQKDNRSTVNNSTSDTMPASFTYLALGDSYTIGHSLPPADNFPNQTTSLLQQQGVTITDPRIIATTGWTTDELEYGIAVAHTANPLQPSYDFVTLLIGVNNQYRGRTVENYKPEFEKLLKKAINYAGNKTAHVVVLSIPDWGATIFASGSDRDRIGREIDAYNAANRQIAMQYNVHYIDITPWTRQALTDHSLLASDGLHPSAKEYKRWAEKLAVYFKTRM